METNGALRTYRIAELAVIELQAQVGWDPFIAYYSKLQRDTDQRLLFEQSFGIVLDQFAAEFSGKLKQAEQ